MSVQIKKRVKRLLDNDRIGISAEAEALIKSDVTRLFEQYFVLKGALKVEIIDDRDKACIKVYGELKDVKRFKMLD